LRHFSVLDPEQLDRESKLEDNPWLWIQTMVIVVTNLVQVGLQLAETWKIEISTLMYGKQLRGKASVDPRHNKTVNIEQTVEYH
jgi:hypothetical protein